jgi:hypothetical protein
LRQTFQRSGIGNKAQQIYYRKISAGLSKDAGFYADFVSAEKAKKDDLKSN